MATAPDSVSHRFRLLDFPSEIIARIGTFATFNRLAFPTGALNRHLRSIFSDPSDIAARAVVRYGSPNLALVAEASFPGDAAVIGILCQRADVDVLVEFQDDECSALQMAAARGHFEAVQCLLDAGVTIVTTYTRNPLLEACRHGHGRILEAFLDRGVDLRRLDVELICAEDCFRAAVGAGHLEIVQILIGRGLYLPEDMPGVLIGSFSVGRLDIVNLLLSNGAELTPSAPGEATTFTNCLSSAAYNGHLDAVKFLLELRGNANIKPDEGPELALISAADGRRMDIFKYLLDRGADINAQDGEVLYQQAISGAYSDDKEVVQIFLRWGAEMDPVIERLKQDGETGEEALAFLKQCLEEIQDEVLPGNK
ncbi:ankyrin [Gonapodya prolifera JEL478]|uniref:Ankyrin n=1 Tax=Gonapodya prolifera (strain JEL478) TaxID=1344416 RepID=A0A139A2C0_GONPJ|nr:ankyrin [Gonapodya prolifera JEL478]|eukprot:KXS10927.1 ankyrin [Gonapodya prolifera JEL478]